MILMSGAGGFVGRALYKRLTAAGYEVLALTHGESFVPSAHGISLDLGNPAHCVQLIEQCYGCRTLIHLAGRIAIQFAPTADKDARPRAVAERFADVYDANVVMTARLLELAQTVGVHHVLFASSQTVYGLPASVPVAEDAPLMPLEHYAASKVACETALALWARGHGRKATILRFPGVWSEERRNGVVHSLCLQAVSHGRVRAGADYPLALDVLHCDDVTSAFEAALDREGENCRVYNVATGEPCSVVRLGNEIAGLVPGCVAETFGVPQPDIALDATRAAEEIGWRARPRRERLGRFIDFLMHDGSHA